MKRILQFLVLMSLAFFVQAQSGPGQIGVSGLTHWVRADVGVATSGSNVTAWGASAGSGYVNGANNPTYVTNAQNGLPVIRFSLTPKQTLQNTSVSYSARSVFVVFKPTSFQGGGSSDNFGQLWGHDPEGVQLTADGRGGRTWSADGSGGSAASGSLSVNGSSLGASNSNPTTPTWTDNVFQVAHLELTANRTLTKQFIADLARSPNTTHGFNGDIAEVLVYDRVLTPVEKVRVNNYLGRKWNVSVNVASLVSSEYTNSYNNNLVLIGSASATQKFDTTAGDGAGIYLKSAIAFATTERIWVGNNGLADGLNNTDVVGFSRNNRIWYINKVNPASSGNVEVSFGTQDLGFGANNQGGRVPADFKLLFRSGTSGNFSEVTATKSFSNSNKVTFTIPVSSLANGYYTLGLPSGDKWYSYLPSGSWDDSDMWTLDASGSLYINPTSKIPGANDAVVILNGKKVNVLANTKTCLSLKIDKGGILDLAATTGHNFQTIAGDGEIRLSSPTFPSYTIITDFASKGKVKFYGSGYTISTNYTFFDVDIDLTATTDKVILAANLTVNGGLIIKKGNLEIGNSSTSRTLSVGKDFYVQSTGRCIVNQAYAGTAVRHNFYSYGNFTNEGICKFSNVSANDYTGAAVKVQVDVRFSSAISNQAVYLDGVTEFYRFVSDKGLDASYELSFVATSIANFKLFGKNNQGSPSDGVTENPHALGLKSGTVRLGANIVIPEICSGGSNYDIPIATSLWVENSNVAMSGSTALVIYGQMKVTGNSAVVNITSPSGITLREVGVFDVQGGTVNLNQLRTSTLGAGVTHFGAYKQSGGYVTIEDKGSASGSYYLFDLCRVDNTFIMSGGTLHVKYKTTTLGSVFINSKTTNYSVTGGNVIVEMLASASASTKISSTVPFYNLILRNSNASSKDFSVTGNSSGSPAIAMANQPLTVLGNLTLETYSALKHNGNNVNIYGNFSIAANASYEYNVAKKNLTSFKGSGKKILDLQNITTVSPQQFSSVSIEFSSKSTDTLLIAASATKQALTDNTLAKERNNDLIEVNGNFKIKNATLNQSFYSVVLKCDTISNTSSELGFAIGGTGTANIKENSDNDRIRINKASVLTRVFDVSGNWGVIELGSEDKVVQLQTDLTGLDRFYFRSGRVFTQNFVFAINDLFTDFDAAQANFGGCGGCFSKEDMIVLSGNASDDGLGLSWGNKNPTTVLYPVGVGLIESDPNARYTPVTFTIKTKTSNKTSYISIGDTKLPTTNQSGNVLSYFWKLKSGFTTAAPTLTSIDFTYNDVDRDGISIATYVPGKVLGGLPFTRTQVGTNANINTTTKNIMFDFGASGLLLENASYTAGDPVRFTGSPTIFYSKGNGGNGQVSSIVSWKNKNNWSNVGHYTSAPVATSAPTKGSIVYIAFDPTIDKAGSAATHYVSLDTNITLGQLIFATTVKDNLGVDYNKKKGPLPKLIIRNYIDTAAFGYMSGRGEVVLEVNCSICNIDPNVTVAKIPVISGDFYDFSDNNSAWNTWEYNYVMPNNTTVYIPTSYPTVYPRMDLDANDGTNRSIIFKNDVFVRSRLRMYNRANLIMNNGLKGDLTITDGLRMDQSSYADNESIKFQSTGTTRTISVAGPIVFESPEDKIYVDSTSANGLKHTFLYRGDAAKADTLNLKDGYLDFFASGINGTTVNFKIENLKYSSFNSNELTISDFSTIDVNNSSTSEFEFKNNFKLSGPSNLATKALNFNSGKITFSDADININLSSGGGDFIIPSTGEMIVNLGKVNVKNGSNLKLGGALTISGGTVDLSSDGFKSNLTYSSTGKSALTLSSGNLLVGGQFMRHLDDDQANINFTQSGGVARYGINGFNSSARGVFEILSSLSKFNYTAGTFKVESGNNSTTVGALHLNNIGIYNVAATSVFILGEGVNSNQTIGVNSTHEIPILTLSSLGDNPTASVIVNTLKVKTVNIGTGSKLVSNNLDVYVSKKWNNQVGLLGYQPGTNTTYFISSTSANITGSTQFNHINSDIPNSTGLQIDASSEVYCKNFYLNGNLNLSSSVNSTGDFTAGTFAQSFVKSIVSTSYYKLVGTTTQIITANQNKPNFDKLYIDNNEGVSLKRIAGQPVTMIVGKELQLENGVLDIFDDKLNFQNGATVTTMSSFSKTKMIRTTGALSQSGVGVAGAANVLYSDFIVPVGVGNTYLPTTITYKRSNAGQFINVKPINQQHQTTLPFSGNLVKAYWNISFLNSSAFDILDLKFGYNQSLAFGNEGKYGSAYLPNNTDWILKVPTDQDGPISADVDTLLNTVKFGFVNYVPISTDYTCGDTKTPVSGNAFPINIPTFVTANSGLWSNGSTWVGGIVPSVGSKVVINSIHNVTLAVNTINTYSVALNGQLDIGSTIKHNFGTINGNGVLKVSGGLIPGGAYSTFLTDTGGVVNFSGSGSYSIDPRVTSARGVIFSGTGTRELPNVAMSIGDSLVVDGVTVDNTINNVSFQVQGDVNVKNGGVFKFGTGGLSFTGKKDSYIKSRLTGLSQLSSLTLDKTDTGKVYLTGDSIFIKSKIDFRKGILQSNNKIVMLGANISYTKAPWDSSYIGGTTCKTMIATTNFDFPTGDKYKFAAAGIYEVTVGNWCARYVRKNPTADGFPITAIQTATPQIKVVNNNDYWIITGGTGAIASKGVSLTWVNSLPLAATTANLVVAEWNGTLSKWYSKGQTSYNAGTKKLQSAGGVTFSTKVFTFATTSTALPVEFGKIRTQVVSNSNIRISWETYTEKNNNYFAVERSLDGVNFVEIGQVQGQGNSASKIEYNYLDQSLETNVYYYRIKQVDFDGQYDYSNIVVQSLKLESKDSDVDFDFIIIPNPAQSGSEVSFEFNKSNSNPIVTVIDVVGNNVKLDNYKIVDNKLKYNANLSAGMYLVRIQYLNKIVTKRLVIQ